ncbi:anthranilate phosphoribosyltransferase [Maritalea mediterranea]|uniref:Anthranilate phosphoribosyltransferase n=1 Tax=Maritalea mediterranea TaxID=2909667 RepID=A0ABS9E6N8_9HYPH|nr:anthranilate phosphoribosyltransferase [Maritalea mediterranea]MCF4098539.1 anthranilate phosphoribosyltransferase [Maritalea mediterranea]
MTIKPILNKLADAQDLTMDEMRQAMNVIMSGDATPSQIGAFLMGLRVKGETVEEIAGAVSILREKMTRVDAPDNAIDIVGTGGDGVGTYNISTAASIIVASSGTPVAKHGNKALSSRSGSSEALQMLGVELDLKASQIGECIKQAGIGFMFAPNHHAAMRFVGPSRQEMGVRTLFNILGPQSNPAGVKQYLLGVYDKKWVRPVADALLKNGATSAWVAHGSDGLDELTTTGHSFVAEIKDGKVREFEVSPEDGGLPVAKLADLLGGTPEANAAAMRKLFDGEKSAYRDVALFNAAAAFIVTGQANDLKTGVKLASELVDSGKAKAKLDELVTVSNGVAQS